MSDNNQDAYQTLGWILNKSESGLFLVIADEKQQKEIVEIYRRGPVEIYDYRQHLGGYSFQKLNDWICSFPKIHTFFIVNFQLAIQNEQDLKRLNFSRDMIAGLGKNLIFLTTRHGEEELTCKAYDFDSFIKMKIMFRDCELEEARLKTKQECYDESKNSLLEVKEDRETFLGEEHSDTGTVYFDLAYIYEQEGMYENAEEFYKKALIIFEKRSEYNLQRRSMAIYKILRKVELDMADIYKGLADVYIRQGRLEEAERLLEKVLLIQEQYLGTKHPDKARIRYDLAGMYEEQEKYEEAEAMYTEVLSIQKKATGEEHVDLKQCFYRMACLCKKQERYQEAEALYIKAVGLKENTAENKGFITVRCYNDLAEIYEKQGRYKEAEKYYEKARTDVESILGARHPITLYICCSLANVYTKLEKWTEAEAIYQKTLPLCEKILGKYHETTEAVQRNLFGIYEKRRLSDQSDRS